MKRLYVHDDKCIENSVASQGKTIEEALTNLREALEKLEFKKVSQKGSHAKYFRAGWSNNRRVFGITIIGNK